MIKERKITKNVQKCPKSGNYFKWRKITKWRYNNNQFDKKIHDYIHIKYAKDIFNFSQ